MKNQALFSLKDKSKKLKCCLLQFLFGALRVNEFDVFNRCTSMVTVRADHQVFTVTRVA